jgi:hypothetical protein
MEPNLNLPRQEHSNSPDEPATASGRRHPRENVLDEFTKLVILLGYLWIVYELLSVHNSIVLSESHLGYPEHAFAIINCMVFAKVLLTRNYVWDIVLNYRGTYAQSPSPARVKPICGQPVTGSVHLE